MMLTVTGTFTGLSISFLICQEPANRTTGLCAEPDVPYYRQPRPIAYSSFYPPVWDCASVASLCASPLESALLSKIALPFSCGLTEPCSHCGHGLKKTTTRAPAAVQISQFRRHGARSQ